MLRDELRALIKLRGGRLHELLGGRRHAPLDRETLRRLVPDIARRDVFICGPAGFTTSVVRAVRALGVPADQVHHEEFAF